MEEHPQARFVIDTLSKAGFLAYYAGGWVRDYLLGHPSDDIDIATNAPPETIQALFSHTVPIGIAFGIILVIIDEHQYEVATFRQDLDYKDGRRPSRVEFTSAIEDAKRRDFTINGMFFDPIQQKILDYVDGQIDLKKKIIRAIGNPHERIQEDRLRMIRAVRLACRFNFAIEPKTQEAIRFHAKELFPAVAIERIWQELTKGHAFHKLSEMLIELHNFGLLSSIFPVLETASLEDIQKRLDEVKFYPQNAPVIAFLLPLFPHYGLQDQLDLCKKLKLPKEDAQFVTFFSNFKKLIYETKDASRYEWAYAYANPLSALCLEILFNKNPSILNKHLEDKENLKKEIARIHQKNPVVKSEDLNNAGIPPGKTMGLLLKEGEKIAINQQIEDPIKILTLLKASPLWPK
jgi:poly(A) polymerase